MKAGECLASARTYTLIMLIAVYLGLTLAWSYSERVGLLVEARQSFAQAYIRSSEANRIGPPGSVPGGGDLDVRRPSVHPRSTWFESSYCSSRDLSLRVGRPDGRQWQAAINSKAACLEGAEKNLDRIALMIGVTKGEKDDFVDVLRKVEAALIDSRSGFRASI
jgi:hypothetical protein